MALWLAFVGALTVAVPQAAHAADCTGNAIVVREHQGRQPGQSSGTSTARRPDDPGLRHRHQRERRARQVDFKIDTDATALPRSRSTGSATTRATARGKIATVNPSASLPQNQPACVTDAATEIYDCGTWGVSASWDVPCDRGLRRLHRPARSARDTGGASHIPFIVRNDASTSTVFFQTSDTTWQAYNTYGGSGLLHRRRHGRAYKVSYNRPFATRGDIDGRDFLFTNEYPMIRFLERNGYDVTYTSGVDSDRRGNLIKNHKIVPVRRPRRVLVRRRSGPTSRRPATPASTWRSSAATRSTGGPAGSPARTGANTANRTLVCYKETWAERQDRPVDRVDRHLARPAVQPTGRRRPAGERPDRHACSWSNYVDLPLTVSAERGQDPAVAQHERGQPSAAGQTATLAPHTVGYESERGHRQRLPAGRPDPAVDHDRADREYLDRLRHHGRARAPPPTT